MRLVRWDAVIANRRRCLAIAVVSAAILSACSGEADDTVASTVAETTTTVAPSVVTDGQLVIGVMVPTGGALIGEPIQVAVDTAVDRINAAGGVLGRSVRAIVADEGDTAASPTAPSSHCSTAMSMPSSAPHPH